MKTVIVTGASRGIGEATVRYLLTKGIRVVGVARTKARLEMLGMEKIGGGGVFDFVVGDVSEQGTAERAVELATSEGHELVGLVLNAGQVGPLGRMADVGIGEFKQCFATNVFANLAFIQRALPYLRASIGRIVMLSSALASLPTIAMSAYCCTKASVEMLAAVLGQEEPAVTTLAVRPGIVETDMLNGLIDKEAEEVLSIEQVAFLRGVDKLEAWQPAKALGDLVLGALPEHSGRCIDWVDADKIIS